MALKRKYEKLELIPEARRGDYVEKNGVWVLDTEDDADDDKSRVAEFRENNVRLQREKAELERQKNELAKQFEGIDPEEFRKAREMMNRLAGDEEKELIRQGKLDDVVARRTAAALKAKDEELTATRRAHQTAEERAKKVTEKLGKLTIERQVQLEIDSLGVKPKKGALDDILNRANRTWRIDENGNAVAVDAENRQVFGKDAQPLTMKEYARSLVLNDATHLFEESKGGGAGGGERSEGAGGKTVVTGTVVNDDQLQALAKGKATMAR